MLPALAFGVLAASSASVVHHLSFVGQRQLRKENDFPPPCQQRRLGLLRITILAILFESIHLGNVHASISPQQLTLSKDNMSTARLPPRIVKVCLLFAISRVSLHLLTEIPSSFATGNATPDQPAWYALLMVSYALVRVQP